jgi:hypothetical protein
MKWRLSGALLAMILLEAGYYAYLHTEIHVTERCHTGAAGDVTCPPPYKPH